MNIERLKRVIENMKRTGLEQIIVSATPSVYYLSGKWIVPGERMLALYVNADGETVLFANRLFAVENDSDLKIIEFGDTDDPIALLAQYVKDGEIGIDKAWPSQFTIRLMQAKPNAKPVLGSAPVDDARMCKDEAEIEKMRESSRMNDIAIEKTIADIRGGMSEKALEECYKRNAKAAGGTGTSFAPITCFGPNCAEPHHANDETVLKPGDSIIIDVGLVHDRYVSDMTRTVFYKSVSEEQKKVYEIVKAANEAGRRAVRPGVPMCFFDRAARKVIEDAGYGEYFIHRTGHGVGVEVHEYPDNSSACHVIAKEGMCFSVEPGIYLPGKFGVRIEDLVVVTKDGCETLNHYPHDLIVIE